MTVPVNNRRIQYTATALQTVFAYDFEIFENTSITVQQTVALTGAVNTLSLSGGDYTVSGVGVITGGNITLTTGAAEDDIITLIGATPNTRSTDFSQAGDFTSEEINEQLDRIVQSQQQTETESSRAVLLNSADTKDSMTLPLSSALASKFLAFDANGDPIAADGITEVPVSPFMVTVLDDVDAETARTTLGAQEDVVTTQGDLVVGNSDGDAVKLAIGTTGKVLMSDGTDPSWEDLPDAAEGTKGIAELSSTAEALAGTNDTKIMTPLNSAQLRGLEIVDEIIINNDDFIELTDLDDGYNHLIISENVIPETNDQGVFARISRDNGSSYITTNTYQIGLDSSTSAGANLANDSAATSVVMLISDTATWGIGNDAGDSANLELMCYNPANATTYNTFRVNTSYCTPSSVHGEGSAVITDSVNAYNAIKLYPEADGFVSGTVKHYRYK